MLDYNKYRAGFLNRQIIVLLSTLGVSDMHFEQLYKEYLEMIKEEGLEEQGALCTRLLAAEGLEDQLYS